MEREVPAHPIFTDIMIGLHETFSLGLLPQTIAMARVGDLSMLSTNDGAHDQIHYQHMGLDTARILDRYPELGKMIDWNAYVAAVSFHDHWKSHLTPLPWNLWIGLHQEPFFASAPAEMYMRSHGFSQDEIKRVSHLIEIHPYSLTDPRRIAREKSVDEKLRFTGRFMFVIDSLDQFRPDRIDAMISYISASTGGIPPALFIRYFARQYAKVTGHMIDLGPEFPWIVEEAARRRDDALTYIGRLVASYSTIML